MYLKGRTKAKSASGSCFKWLLMVPNTTNPKSVGAWRHGSMTVLGPQENQSFVPYWLDAPKDQICLRLIFGINSFSYVVFFLRQILPYMSKHGTTSWAMGVSYRTRPKVITKNFYRCFSPERLDRRLRRKLRFQTEASRRRQSPAPCTRPQTRRASNPWPPSAHLRFVKTLLYCREESTWNLKGQVGHN